MPRMRSPQELLRDSRRELLSRSPRSSSPLERSEPIALMERGRTCGLFFRPLRNRPRSNRPCNSPPHGNHSLLQPPPPQRPPYLSQRRVADEPWRRMFAARTARHRPHAALRRTVTRTLPSPQQPPRRPMKLASIPLAAAALRHRLARIAPYAFSFRRMHAISPLLAMFARNVCFSRSEWQDPRPMRPFPGAIGWFWIHGVSILPERSPFRVEKPEIMHDTKMLPRLLGLQSGQKNRIPKRGSYQ